VTIILRESISRNYQIDFLRGMAILAVMTLHFHLSYQLDQSAISQILFVNFIKAIAMNGNYGVTVFFVISGFLITITTLERYGELSKVDMIGFYIFRFARIVPCLLLVLSLIAVFSYYQIPIFKNDPNTTSMFVGVLSVLTFWHNVLMDKIGYFNYCLNIYWSLSVEEIFYITFPLLCLMVKKTRFIVFCLLALVVVAPIYRSHYATNEIIALYGYLSCFDAIAIGCLAAITARKIQLSSMIRRVMKYFAGILLVVVYLYSGIMENVVVGVSLMAISTAVILVAASQLDDHKNISIGNVSKAVCWLGKNSYELYLFHIIVLALMKEAVLPESLGSVSKLIWFAVFVALSALVAGGISTFYSQPMNRKLRDVLFGFRQPYIFEENPFLSK
jgi:peptidoglycan/LPS O-acetylase OafA/YrhL